MFLLISIGVEEKEKNHWIQDTESKTEQESRERMEKALKCRQEDGEGKQWESLKILEIVSIINIHCVVSIRTEERAAAKHAQLWIIAFSSWLDVCHLFKQLFVDVWEGIGEVFFIQPKGFWPDYDDLTMRDERAEISDFMHVSKRNKHRKRWKWRRHVSAHRRFNCFTPKHTNSMSKRHLKCHGMTRQRRRTWFDELSKKNSSMICHSEWGCMRLAMSTKRRVHWEFSEIHPYLIIINKKKGIREFSCFIVVCGAGKSSLVEWLIWFHCKLGNVRWLRKPNRTRNSFHFLWISFHLLRSFLWKFLLWERKKFRRFGDWRSVDNFISVLDSMLCV